MTEPGAPTEPARRVRELAEQLGIDPDVAERSGADGTLGLLVVEHLALTHPAVFTQDEVEARTGLGTDARRFWRALGFPDPDPEEPTFTAADLEMLQLVDAIIRLELLEHESALQLARVIGSSMQRIAQAQVDAVDARLSGRSNGEPDVDLAVQRAEILLPAMPKVLEYAWRRHLQSVVRLRLAQADLGDDGPPPRAVGFADLVGFTALSQQLDDHDLAEVVERFETTAYDVVSVHGGRVVKMIGDEVMFEVADPAAAALIGLELADAFHDDDIVSDVRVGIAYGSALAREGDLFGPTVNLAARLVGIAYGGAVVVTAEVREALRDDPRFAFKSMRGRYLKNIGRVRLFVVRRVDDTDEGVAERARRRSGVLGERVVELVERAKDERSRTDP
jgi:adenylate cyclase